MKTINSNLFINLYSMSTSNKIKLFFIICLILISIVLLIQEILENKLNNIKNTPLVKLNAFPNINKNVARLFTIVGGVSALAQYVQSNSDKEQAVIEKENNLKSNIGLTISKIIKGESNLLPQNWDNWYNLDNWNKFLKTLSHDQVGALANLLFSQVILSASISIFFIYYGDVLINRFNLEIKYPKLAKLISLRRKFQQYYLLVNLA